MYSRQCQECGHRQIAKDPTTYKNNNENWTEVKCKKCKSIALDYGTDAYELVNGVWQDTRTDE